MNDVAELIEAIGRSLKGVSWPIVCVVAICFLRKQLGEFLAKITELWFEFKGGNLSVHVKKENKTAADAVPLDEKQVIRLAGRASARSTASGTLTVTANPSVINPARELLASMANDLNYLESCSAIAESVPRAAIQQSWEILKKNVIKTAKVFGFEKAEDDRNELNQSLFFLTTRAFESQEVMIAVYSLANALKKVTDTPDLEVNRSDSRSFVKNCLAVVAFLSKRVEAKILPEQ